MKYGLLQVVSLLAILTMLSSTFFGSTIAQAMQPHLDSCDPPPEQPKKSPKK